MGEPFLYKPIRFANRLLKDTYVLAIVSFHATIFGDPIIIAMLWILTPRGDSFNLDALNPKGCYDGIEKSILPFNFQLMIHIKW